MIVINKNIINEELVLERFNMRESRAFSDIYLMYYDEFYYFTQKLIYDSNLSTEDVLQDVFVNIWENNKRSFDTLAGLRIYIYVCIKNRFRNYISHSKHVNIYKDTLLSEDRFIAEAVETETMSIISQAIDILPEECAKVFKLHLEGWDVKDIASELGKAESTIYRQKQDAIKILRKKLSERKMLIIMLLIP